MGEFLPFSVNPTACRREVTEFASLLTPTRQLGETSHLLPFFKRHRHLAAFLAMDGADRLGFEVGLAGGFRADILVGDSRRGIYCLVELEDAKPRSVFGTRPRLFPAWSARFERGFSQLVDWLYLAADLRRTDILEATFGARPKAVFGILLIGRTPYVTAIGRSRLDWRQAKVLVDSQQVKCLTFDDALSDAQQRLAAYDYIAQRGARSPRRRARAG